MAPRFNKTKGEVFLALKKFNIELYLASENLAGSYTIYGRQQTIHYLIWYNHKITVRQLFVSEI